MAELDAINLYEQMAAAVKDKEIKDVADEEKTHLGSSYPFKLDKRQVEELEKGKKEVKELLGGE
jgi:rubrerythrin